MRASVIIPTHNKVERLRLALTALQAQTIGTGQFEVVIAADGCTDSTLEEAEAFSGSLALKVLETPQLGQSGARNLAARHAVGQVLVFIDDDILLSPDYLQTGVDRVTADPAAVVRARVYTLRYLRPFRDPEQGILYAPGRTGASRPRMEKMLISRQDARHDFAAITARGAHLGHFEAMIDSIMKVGPARLRWAGYSGSGVMIEADLFRRAGGYDESFGLNWGAEALELGYRLARMGARFVQLDDISSLHMDHPRGGSIETFEQSFSNFFERYQDQDILMIKKMIEPGLQGI